MTAQRAVLLCGVATDPPVWDATADRLSAAGFHVDVPRRPRSGDLATEIDFLAPRCDGAVVFGVSGGATLGLELAARGVEMAAAFLHEPAAGSWAPGLLDHVAEAFTANGVEGFGAALYGQVWRRTFTADDEVTVGRELAMFRSFEPRPPTTRATSVTLTVGERSPAARHASVATLCREFALDSTTLPRTSHAAHLDDAFAEVIAHLNEL